MNKNSQLAIEYINILNTEIADPECLKYPPAPIDPPTTLIPTTIGETSTQTELTTEIPSTVHQSTTTANDPEPSAPFFGISLRIWKILSGILVFTFVFSLCLLIYVCFFYRNATAKLRLVNDIDANAKQPYNRNDAISYYSGQDTLPRLKVIDDKINGVSIVGDDSTRTTYGADFNSRNSLSRH